MKTLGIALLLTGAALLLFIGYTFIKEKNRLLTPLPEEKGVKVIIVTPTQ